MDLPRTTEDVVELGHELVDRTTCLLFRCPGPAAPGVPCRVTSLCRHFAPADRR